MSRSSEFARGVGQEVFVDNHIENGQLLNRVHLSAACPYFDADKMVGVFPTERTARAAVPGVSPCRSCRG